MKPLDQDTHPSDYGFHRWMTSGRPEGECADHVGQCAHCQQRIATFATEQQAFLAQFPFSRFQEKLDQHELYNHQTENHQAQKEHTNAAKTSGSWWLQWWTPQWAVLAAVCLLGVVIGIQQFIPPDIRTSHTPNRPVPNVITKGIQIDWVVKRAGLQLRVDREFPFQDGDQLGIRVQTSKDCFATLVLTTPEGRLQQWLPQPQHAPIFIRAGQKTMLPESLLLQRPIRTQGIYLLLTPAPISLDALQTQTTAAFKAFGVPMTPTSKLPLDGYQESRWVTLP